VPITDPVVTLPGPWAHRTVSANGTRYHVVEAGSGPLVLLLHGFPEFWWAWRHQLTSFAAAGYRVVAADLRGYGGSDHPPRGYDLPSLSDDAAALVRSLGESDAVIVGHDWGGLIGWTCAVRHPKVVRRLVAVSTPHPRRLRASVLGHASQLRASGHAFSYQTPWAPERKLRADDAAEVGRLLHEWAAPGWPDEETTRIYRAAFQIGNTPFCALEYFRWVVRSLPRPDGVRYASSMATPIDVPVLQVHGAADPVVLPTSAQGSSQYVTAPYRWRLLEGVGHFPHEEDPQRFDATVLEWLNDPEPDR
jgi:pimeloyl-ACP methyl ester carboxylesterase